jgi:hypothetical protein
MPAWRRDRMAMHRQCLLRHHGRQRSILISGAEPIWGVKDQVRLDTREGLRPGHTSTSGSVTRTSVAHLPFTRHGTIISVPIRQTQLPFSRHPHLLV